jgi:hypothetical protein
MPDTSPNLDLPYLLPSQAQKHVTHNEALERLDMLAQLTLQGLGAQVPPPAPADGTVWALGPAPQGDWAGQAGRLAVRIGGAWSFIDPREGWRAWSLAEAELRVWRGADWRKIPLDDLPGLGIGTVHDSTNRLSVVAPATLLSHEGAGHQLKISKAGPDDTATLLLQTGWSGRAEMGLAGNDDFSVKVSADGAAWTEALRLDRVTGKLSGAAVTLSATDTTTGRLVRTRDYGLGLAIQLGAADNLDAVLTGGFYYNPSAANTTGNTYPLASAGALLVIARSTTNVVQKFVAHGGAGTAAALREYSRSYGSAGWTPWVETLHQGNVIGTVSQVAGVPTGKLVERGSNANGEFMKFADGTQICTATRPAVDALEASNAANAVFRHTALLTWTFPAAFAAAPVVSGNGGVGTRWLGIAAGSANNVTYRVYSTFSDTALAPPGLTAIGRWF